MDVVLAEGTLIAVPLDDGNWGVGIVARCGARGAMLGYFSNRYFENVPEISEAIFSPDESIWIAVFGDLGIIEGRWKVLGVTPNWVRDEWPLPDFGRTAELSGRSFRVRYPDGDLRARPVELAATAAEITGLPQAGLAGAGFVESRLTKLVTEK